MKNAWRKFTAGSDGRPVLYQKPNGPLIIWAVFELASRAISGDPWHMVLSGTALFAILVWAFLEIFQGGSYFRRALGAIVLGLVVASRLW